MLKLIKIEPTSQPERLRDIYEKYGICYPTQKKYIRLSLNLKVIKTFSFLYGMYLGFFGTVNFFFGYGVGGLEVAMKYAGYFLSTSVMLLVSTIPFLGAGALFFFHSYATQIMSLLGLTHNFWIDVMVNNLIHVTGIVIQIFVVVAIVNEMAAFVSRKRRAKMPCIESTRNY